MGRIAWYVVGVVALGILVAVALGGMGIGTDGDEDGCSPGRYRDATGECVTPNPVEP